VIDRLQPGDVLVVTASTAWRAPRATCSTVLESVKAILHFRARLQVRQPQPSLGLGSM
jgi:hypothetical protein